MSSQIVLSSHSLPAQSAAAGVLQAALQAVDPYRCVHSRMERAGAVLRIGRQSYDLSACRRVLLVAVGKAAAPMARAAAEALGEFLSAGIVVTKDGHIRPEDRAAPGLEFYEAGHPIPDERSVQAAGRVLGLLAGGAPEDLVLFLVSGGGSALLTLPAPPLALDDLQALTGLLLASGATINEINTVRKHLDLVKGGGIARQAFPARLAALVLSDVVGSPLEVIASGPAVADPTTFAEALAVLETRLAGRTPPAVLQRLQAGTAGQVPETPKPGDPLFKQVRHWIAASGEQAVQAAAGKAAALGAQVEILSTALQGEARQAGPWLAGEVRKRLKNRHSSTRPLCLLAGGETTVTLKKGPAGDRPGLGGRNQELALSLVNSLAGMEGVLAVTLATDGGDGPTDAAGAVVTGQTRARALALGLEPQDFLARNDSYHFFQPLGDLLITGPTQTNVNDLVLVWISPG